MANCHNAAAAKRSGLTQALGLATQRSRTVKLFLAVTMLLAIGGLWYYNEKASEASAQAAIAAQNHKPFQPFDPNKVRVKRIAFASSESAPAASAGPAPALTPQAQQFSCDGRTHCSHMRSCEEAKFFIKHCPNTQMDGDNDGIPCESQWC